MTRRQWITVCGIAVASAVVASTATSLWAHNSAEADLTSKANSLSADISSVNSSLGSVNSTLTSGLNSTNTNLTSTSSSLSNTISSTATGVEGSLTSTFAPLPITVPLTKGVLEVDTGICVSCMNCAYACSLYNGQTGSREVCRIQLNAFTNEVFDAYSQPCEQCADPQCMRYCPHGAIYIDTTSGTNARVIDPTKCFGCQTCITKCPFTPPRPRYDDVKKQDVKCWLCGGNPQCVKACITGALQYITDPNGIETGYEGPGE